jgi:hypothetical protein
MGTVVAMGRMIYPSLKQGGYNERFAVGLIASSGAIAVRAGFRARSQLWSSPCPSDASCERMSTNTSHAPHTPISHPNVEYASSGIRINAVCPETIDPP